MCASFGYPGSYARLQILLQRNNHNAIAKTRQHFLMYALVLFLSIMCCFAFFMMIYYFYAKRQEINE
ncbi:hypothetical protein D7I68_23480 [Salmonella enterica]|uniref:Uncharacterized protein n=1 Tax=Salmonella enterica I TaxID=59201 RepID=A0A7Z1PLZ9_SALET|nr:hypothetical protein [Salmonella enterica]ECA5352490.1 hypothetical protein [Salmonella enterica subsp. enterica serovar Mississippi]ECU0288213.1 hypothetical protein [Salmonella enterica subsp. enterica serovar Rubislaw]ECU2047193.1 hypothetical protein [Salmonella enterica subsp. enterica serovar Thompson]PTU37930.1 hypothetical protein DAY03_28135 [Salmonella enterica subsp. enterica]